MHVIVHAMYMYGTCSTCISGAISDLKQCQGVFENGNNCISTSMYSTWISHTAVTLKLMYPLLLCTYTYSGAHSRHQWAPDVLDIQ